MVGVPLIGKKGIASLLLWHSGSVVAISANVVDLFEVFGGVHACVSWVFVGIYLSDNMCDERVFKNDISEALVVHFLKDCELIRSFDPNHIQQVKPEMLKLVWVQIYDAKVLSDANDHLVKGHRALGILFDQFRC